MKLSIQFECENDTILQGVTKLVSVISDFAAKVQDNFTVIKDGILALDAKITELQNTPDPITPSDQALLDGIVEQSATLAAAAKTFPPPTPPQP